MNFKMSFLATALVALFAVSANAQIIHESDFEAESATGFGIAPETMLFTDGGGDLIGFQGNGNPLMTGDALGVSAANPNSGSFSYAVDVGVTTDTGGPAPDTGVGNGWGAAWCGANTENGSGGFSTPEAATEAGDGCYVDFSAGATFTATCQIATDALNPLTGAATGEIRLEFNNVGTNPDGSEIFNPDIIARQISPRLGAADLTAAYQEITISYTLTQADIDAGIDAGTPINSCAAVMGIEAAAFGGSTGLILFDDFVFEVNPENVVIVGEGHAAVADVLKGDVEQDGDVDFNDIMPFIAVLQSGGDQAEADCNCDGGVDFGDIAAFIAILQSQ